MHPPVIFLDIDGVLVPDGDDPSNTVFHPRCVEAFKSILGNERCVFTKPDRGLTTGDTERAVEILRS